MHEVEIVVLGGGPAGFSCAVSLTQAGYAVALLDKGRPTTRLGECLPSEAKLYFQKLGVWPLFQHYGHIPCWSIESAWNTLRIRTHDLSFHPYGCAWLLNREAFNRFLLDAAKLNGVAIWPVSATQVGRLDGGWQVMCDRNEKMVFAARFVVDATGRRSWFSKQLGIAKNRFDSLIAVAAENSLATVGDSTHNSALIETSDDGWWYSTPSVGIYFSDCDLVTQRHISLREFWEIQLSKTEYTKKRLRTLPFRAGTVRTHCAFTTLGITNSGAGWLAVGDAAFACDPLASDGILFGLESGIKAAAAIDAQLRGQDESLAAYSRFVLSRAAGFLRLRERFYKQVYPSRTRDFWRRRAVPPTKIVEL